jgi:hypothetical protein
MVATTLNRLITKDDSFAQNTTASRKKSRSLLTHASSSFNRASLHKLRIPLPPCTLKPLSVSPFASRRHLDKRFGLTPNSKAICQQRTLGQSNDFAFEFWIIFSASGGEHFFGKACLFSEASAVTS